MGKRTRLSESAYLHGEARGARAAIRRTVGDLRRTGGRALDPRESFGRHAWISTGVVVTVGALLGLAVYEFVLKKRPPGYHRFVELTDRCGRERRRSPVRSFAKALTWLGGNLAMLKTMLHEPEPDVYDDDGAKPRTR